MNAMQPTSAASFGLAALAGLALVLPATAAVTIDWVTVGNAGNAPDPATGSLYGAVAHEYKLARNETTIGQYADFLNAVAKSDPYSLYNPSMATSYINGISRSGMSGGYSYIVNPGSANKPITYVSWFDAARFSNWLHNGQGNGSTETGAYTLNGLMSGVVQKNADARFWIPTENEWYKAAYYDPTKGGTGGYWPYPTQSNALGGNTIGVPNSANYYDGDYVGYPGMALTDVGAYGPNSDSYYGTNDQGGNVWEWNDAVIAGASRGSRGGAWNFFNMDDLHSSVRSYLGPASEGHTLGFRVAAVPEPGALALAMLSGGLLLIRRRR